LHFNVIHQSIDDLVAFGELKIRQAQIEAFIDIGENLLSAAAKKPADGGEYQDVEE
jgi:uncharacterized protein YutE (UPF0331/DUF86 family)